MSKLRKTANILWTLPLFKHLVYVYMNYLSSTSQQTSVEESALIISSESERLRVFKLLFSWVIAVEPGFIPGRLVSRSVFLDVVVLYIGV